MSDRFYLEDNLIDTARFTAAHARLYPDALESGPWLAIGGCLMAQQAAALALIAAGDVIPAKAGGAELLMRAATPARLPAPYTLPWSHQTRRMFDALIAARNAYLHPREEAWSVDTATLGSGLASVCDMAAHLILVQPIRGDLVSPHVARSLRESLEDIRALAEFLSEA